MTILPSTQLLLSHKVIFFLVALSISSASSLASVIAILMTAMINANPISAAIPKMSFHHISLILVFLVDGSYLLGYLVPVILAHIIVDVL